MNNVDINWSVEFNSDGSITFASGDANITLNMENAYIAGQTLVAMANAISVTSFDKRPKEEQSSGSGSPVKVPRVPGVH